MAHRPKIPLMFYRTPSGKEPVREWLLSLPDHDCDAIGTDLQRVQWRFPIGMPLCRPMSDGLWEVRTALEGHREARVFICLFDDRLVALHGLIKKTRATPEREQKLARKRKADVEKG